MKAKLTVLFAVALAVVGLGVASSYRAEASRAAALPAPSFAGTWQTTWAPHYNEKSAVSAPVTVTVDTGDSNALDGSVQVKNGANGVMYGKVSLDGRVWTWKGNWWNTDGNHGSFAFKLTDPNNFTGTYKIAGSDKEYDWHGNK